MLHCDAVVPLQQKEKVINKNGNEKMAFCECLVRVLYCNYK